MLVQLQWCSEEALLLYPGSLKLAVEAASSAGDAVLCCVMSVQCCGTAELPGHPREAWQVLVQLSGEHSHQTAGRQGGCLQTVGAWLPDHQVSSWQPMLALQRAGVHAHQCPASAEAAAALLAGSPG
jgi:hypothetical protein